MHSVYCLQHWAAVWFVNRLFAAGHSHDTKAPSRKTKVAKGTRQTKDIHNLKW